jgi:GDPmannose 4,6-dehydratase
MFGLVQSRPQNEKTPFYPRSPYGVAKVYAHWITKNYREAYGMFACSGILFNHESPRRGETFVTRKITRAAAAIAMGSKEPLYLGNLNAVRDWGHAKDYVEAIWMMLQLDQPEDLVIASGETHSVREFVEIAFRHIGITIGWKGEGVNEVGFDAATGRELVRIDPRYFRPAEVDYLCGDASVARKTLGWVQRHSFEQLVADMMEHDLRQAAQQSKECAVSQVTCSP